MITTASRTFTLSDELRARWRVRDFTPENVIEWLVECGFVERAGDGEFVVTALGLQASQAWLELAAEVVEIDA